MDPRYQYQQNSAPDYHQQQPQQNQQQPYGQQQNQQQHQQQQQPYGQQQQQQPDRYSTPHYMPQRSSSVYNPSYHKSRFGFWYWFRWLFALIPLTIGALVLFKPQIFENLINDISNKVDNKTAASTRAMQHELLTYGPGGDITLEDPRFFHPSGCMSWTPKKGVTYPKTTPSIGCYAPHTVEFFETTGYPKTGVDKDAAYPTPEQWLADAGAKCSKKFLDNSYVAIPNKEDALKFWILVPSTENWKTKIENGYANNTREYYCFAAKADGTPLTGPLNGK